MWQLPTSPINNKRKILFYFLISNVEILVDKVTLCIKHDYDEVGIILRLKFLFFFLITILRLNLSKKLTIEIEEVNPNARNQWDKDISNSSRIWLSELSKFLKVRRSHILSKWSISISNMQGRRKILFTLKLPPCEQKET